MPTANNVVNVKTNWNFVRGCTKCSPACANCYGPRCFYSWGNEKRDWAKSIDVTASPTEWNGKIHLGDLPLRPSQKPRRYTWSQLPYTWNTPSFVFVNDIGDTFHKDVPDAIIDRACQVMENNPQHTFRLITKRGQRMREYLTNRYPNGVPANIQPGVSVGCMADLRNANELTRIPVKGLRWLSIEPLIEAVTLPNDVLDGVKFVVLGGESGPKARRMMPEWARTIRDQVKAPGRDICFHFKQWGNIGPDGVRRARKHWEGVDVLDGRTWREFPDGKNWYESEELWKLEAS